MIKSSEFTLGPHVDKFEKAFSKFIGVKNCIATNSGTDSLILALKSLSVKKDDEVITVCNSFYATAGAIVACGAKPVFVDCDERYQIDINKIEKAITKKTKAIVVVHYLGVPVDMPKVMSIAKKHKLFVLEDCALSLGAKVDNIHTGLHGHAGVFSFYPVKHITSAEGGMVITNNKKLANKNVMGHDVDLKWCKLM